MPISFKWDSEKKEIVRIEIVGDWTWQEYNDAVIQLIEMSNSVDHRVDFIADMRKSGRVPAGEYSSQHLKRGSELRPENYGITVNVGADILTKVTFTSGDTPRLPRLYVNTIEEAYDIIKKERTLDNLSSDKEAPEEENNQSAPDG